MMVGVGSEQDSSDKEEADLAGRGYRLCRREMRKVVANLSLWYFKKYFEILPTTLNLKISRKLRKIIE